MIKALKKELTAETLGLNKLRGFSAQVPCPLTAVSYRLLEGGRHPIQRHCTAHRTGTVITGT